MGILSVRYRFCVGLAVWVLWIRWEWSYCGYCAWRAVLVVDVLGIVGIFLMFLDSYVYFLRYVGRSLYRFLSSCKILLCARICSSFCTFWPVRYTPLFFGGVSTAGFIPVVRTLQIWFRQFRWGSIWFLLLLGPLFICLAFWRYMMRQGEEAWLGMSLVSKSVL